MGLFELSEGRFQLIEQGPMAPFMSGYRYLLVEQPLAAFFAECRLERVRYQPATVWNRSTGEENHGYMRLTVGQFFRPDQINDLPLNGPRLLTMNEEHYFASPDLKAALEINSFPYLRFSEGLSEFAGRGA